MQDRQLYQEIPGISSPWEVTRVGLRLAAGDIHVQLSHAADTTTPCHHPLETCG